MEEGSGIYSPQPFRKERRDRSHHRIGGRAVADLRIARINVREREGAAEV
jgi:hypothetical protein